MTRHVPDWLSWSDETRPQAAARWRKKRTHGKRAFVWRYGVAGWGVPAGVFTAFLTVFRQYHFTGVWALPPAVLVRCGAALAVFPLLGYVLGSWLWEISEENLRRADALGDAPRS